MSNIEKIADWLTEHINDITVAWLSAPAINEIFLKYHIDILKFSDKFAQEIILHNLGVFKGIKQADDCPIMNQFVDMMLRQNINSQDIYTICTGLRTTIFDTLLDKYESFSQDKESMRHICKVFDKNLAGVLFNFDTKNVANKQDLQKEKELKKYIEQLQTVFDLQSGIVFQLQDITLRQANKMLFITAGVKDRAEFEKRYIHPLSFIHRVSFENTLFKTQEYTKWIEDLLNKNEGECEVELFDHTSNQSSLMYMKIAKVPQSSAYIFTLTDINRQKKEIKRLKEIVYQDPLTKMPNRQSFQERLEEKIESCEEKKCKILTVHMRGFKVLNETYGTKKGDEIIKSVAVILKKHYGTEAARTDLDRFSIISKKINIVNANKVMDEINNTLKDEEYASDIILNSALTSLRKDDTAKSALERSDMLLQEAKCCNDHAVYDESLIEKRLKEKKRTQSRFLQEMQNYMDMHRTLPITTQYLEVAIHSDAKILHVTEFHMLVEVRKIAVYALYKNDLVFIRMPEKPYFQAKVDEIDLKAHTLLLSNFETVENSILERKSVHVKIQEDLEIRIETRKNSFSAELESLSMNSFVMILDHLYDMHIGTHVSLKVQLLDRMNTYEATIERIIPFADKFKIVAHLIKNAQIEEELTTFISKRQREIIQELQKYAQ